MRRFAQYIDAEDGTPAGADNANNLDGKNGTAYRTEVAYFDCGFAGQSSTNCATSTIPVGSAARIGQTALEVPSAGVTELTGSVTAVTTGSDQFVVWITRASTCASDPPGMVSQAVGGKLAVTSDTTFTETLDVFALESVPAGTRTYRLCAIEFGTVAPQPVFTGNLYARWTGAPTSVITGSSGTVTDHGDGVLGGFGG